MMERDMTEELLAELRKITPEEQRILDGQNEIEKETVSIFVSGDKAK